MAPASPSSPLSEEAIVREAFALLEERGAESLSMRALAARLGASPMGLYTYVRSKDELVDRVVARLREEYDNRPVPGERWDGTVRRIASSIRDVNRRYPQVHRAVATRVPDLSLHARRVLQIHRDQGMPPDVARLLWCTVEAYLGGFVRAELKQNRAWDTFREGWEQACGADGGAAGEEPPFGDASFSRGLGLILAGIRSLAPGDEAAWVTPEDPARWTWR